MFAVIETGGKQYKVKQGDELAIERLDLGKSLPAGRQGDNFKLDNVLLLSGDNALEVGRPFIKGAYCEAELVKEFRGPKVISFKYIRREKSATKVGHRQNYLKVKIKSIHKGA